MTRFHAINYYSLKGSPFAYGLGPIIIRRKGNPYSYCHFLYKRKFTMQGNFQVPVHQLPIQHKKCSKWNDQTGRDGQVQFQIQGNDCIQPGTSKSENWLSGYCEEEAQAMDQD